MKQGVMTILLIAVAAASAAAEEVLNTFSAPHLQTTATGATGQATSTTVLTIEAPAITTSIYAVEGKVKYSDVEGKGYLEMLNSFSEGQYFTRATQNDGPMGALTGSSDWREFRLPFNTLTSEERTTKLIINVVLPGAGVVELSDVRLVQFARPSDATKAAGQWWSDRQAGMVGGIGGAVIGCIGGLIGTLAGLGKARRLVMGLMTAMIALGVLLLALAGVALACSQPFAVWYAPSLIGGILIFVLGGQIRMVRKRYEQRELRKIQAMDA